MKSTTKLDASALRAFGLIVGGILLVIAFWPIIKQVVFFLARTSLARWWAFIPGLALVLLALMFPESLARPYKYWMVIGEHLGWFNTRLILGGIFFLLITPMGVVMRLFGYDPLRVEPGESGNTFAIPARKRDPMHMKRQF